jgi:hypothetical protein
LLHKGFQLPQLLTFFLLLLIQLQKTINTPINKYAQEEDFSNDGSEQSKPSVGDVDDSAY